MAKLPPSTDGGFMSDEWKLGIIGVPGFTETEHEGSDTQQLAKAAEDLFETSSRVEVYEALTWKYPAKHMVERLKRDGITHVIIFSYSWGAGYGANHLARECIEAGILVERLLLCDPVYRPLWAPPWMGANLLAVRALFPGEAVITYPAGIVKIDGVRQYNNMPQAHKIRIGKKGKPYHLKHLLGENHGSIDRAPEWREMVISNISEVSSRFTAA